MSTEERDESQPRPRKVIPSIRRDDNEPGERRPYNQGGYGRSEGNYERRPYNQSRDSRGGGYNNNRPSYRDNNNSYSSGGGGYQNRPRQYDNRDGGYNRSYNQGGNRNNGGGYNNYNDGGYNNNRNYDRQEYGDQQYNRPVRTYSSDSDGGDGLRKRRPRVGDARTNSYDNRGGGGMNRSPYSNRQSSNSYGNNRGGGGGYNNNRRPGGGGGFRRTDDYNPNAKYSLQKQLKYKEVLTDPNEPIRLNKFLANAGVCSRREADEFIQSGAITVNDQVVKELGTKITRSDKVMFNDKTVEIESKLYVLLNKPKNCVTTSDDPQERLTVMDLVKGACDERIYPVGRLDRNTTGVLLLTNDGDLASKLTHPSFKKKKIYHVWLDKNVAIEDLEKIANGIELEDGEIHADAISYASEYDKSQVGIEIHSGRNRIVRRIFESLGYRVVKLDRVYFAGLTKKALGRGKWRYLNEREVNSLRMGSFE
jgi:pseudouridine synthase